MVEPPRGGPRPHSGATPEWTRTYGRPALGQLRARWWDHPLWLTPPTRLGTCLWGRAPDDPTTNLHYMRCLQCNVFRLGQQEKSMLGDVRCHEYPWSGSCWLCRFCVSWWVGSFSTLTSLRATRHAVTTCVAAKAHYQFHYCWPNRASKENKTPLFLARMMSVVA